MDGSLERAADISIMPKTVGLIRKRGCRKISGMSESVPGLNRRI